MLTYLDGTMNCSVTGWQGADAGGKMKETGTTHWASPNTGATNTSGFTGMPEGNRGSTGGFANLTIYANLWTTAESSSTNAWGWSLSNFNAQVSRYASLKADGFSGRCIKD